MVARLYWKTSVALGVQVFYDTTVLFQGVSVERHAGDILIIGAGLAGIVCALRLLDQGRRVLLLDRDSEPHLGGLAKESFGGILLVDTPEQRRQRIHDTPERALQDWLRFGAFGHDESMDHWPRRWAEHYVHDCMQDVYHWLRAQGLSFLPLPLWVERGMTPDGGGNSVPRWHVVWGTGQGLMRTLVQRLQQHPQRDRLTLLCNHRVETLQTQAGAVHGCAGIREDNGAAFEVQAAVLVVAAGGINGNLDLVRQHWHADWSHPPAVILNGAHPFADGRLHHAAQLAGAELTHLDRQWNYAAGIRHWRPRKPDHGLSLVPPRSALWLNRRGERIWPPLVNGYDTRDLVTQICAQEQGMSWQLLNRRIALKELAISGAEFNPSIRTHSKLGLLREILFGNRWLVNEVLANSSDVVVAGSLDELAAKMNALQGDSAVQPATLRDVVTRYDAEVAKGDASTDPQRQRIAELRQWKGDRLRTCKAQPILDDKALPLIAIREHIISRKSLGGIHTNLACEALRPDGSTVPGLYAIGEAAGFGGGGMNGLRALEGTFLGGCVYSAQRLARALSEGGR